MLSSNNSYGSLLVFNTGHSKKKLKSFFFIFSFYISPLRFFLVFISTTRYINNHFNRCYQPGKRKMITLNVIFHCMCFFDRKRPKKKKMLFWRPLSKNLRCKFISNYYRDLTKTMHFKGDISNQNCEKVKVFRSTGKIIKTIIYPFKGFSSGASKITK